jgi:hypothetical protein
VVFSDFGLLRYWSLKKALQLWGLCVSGILQHPQFIYIAYLGNVSDQSYLVLDQTCFLHPGQIILPGISPKPDQD